MRDRITRAEDEKMRTKIVVTAYRGVFAWFVKRGIDILAGGYCAMAKDARNDARIWLKSAGRFQRN